MSTYAEGTIVRSTAVEEVKYEYAPREAHDERAWRAIDVPQTLILLMGDENGEIRFYVEDIQESIDDGNLIIIHTP